VTTSDRESVNRGIAVAVMLSRQCRTRSAVNSFICADRILVLFADVNWVGVGFSESLIVLGKKMRAMIYRVRAIQRTVRV
jgi:hypothetical protein